MSTRKKPEQDIADAAPAPSPKREDGPPLPGFKLRHTLRGHTGAINRIAGSPDGRIIASPSKLDFIHLRVHMRACR
jgi:WD40 repeat protein